MSKLLSNRLSRLLTASLIVIVLGACSSPANREAMRPTDMAINKHFPYALHVKTGGGAETGAMDSSNIADADLKAAIEDAVTQSKLFKSVVQGSDGDYELSVSVTSLNKPVFGGTFTVDMETAWSLVKLSDKKVVMQRSVKASGTATMGDAFAAVTRLRLAVEAAARNSISEGLQAIAGLNL